MSISTRNNLCKYLCLFLLLALFGCQQRCVEPPSITPPAEDFCASDLAFRLGRSLQSGLIASAGNGARSYSHIGIIIKQDSAMMVVHIEPDNTRPDERIISESIEDFFAYEDAVAGCVMRYNDLNVAQRDAVGRHAVRLINSGVEFDHDYRLSDTTAMYCTELVEYIFSLEKIDLSQSRCHALPLVAEPVILPSGIAENSNLTEIWQFAYDLRPAR